MALRGVTVLEIAGLAPAPFCGMLLADHGARVLRVDRPRGAQLDVLSRGKSSLALDLKQPAGVRTLCRLAARADVLIEPFRPGVMERLGLGPKELCAINPRLVYARLSGYGQTGPLRDAAGHDINYLSLSGALGIAGHANENPAFAANLLGDFGGGGLMCALGIVMALFERQKSNKGQVVDASITDGSAYLSAFAIHSKDVFFQNKRGRNLLDSGAHFYDSYRCADDKYMAVGAIEPQFYAEFIKTIGLSDSIDLSEQMDEDQWPSMKEKIAKIFSSKPRSHWENLFKDRDACVTPVLELDELDDQPLSKERGWILENGEVAGAPRLSRTPAYSVDDELRSRPIVGANSISILLDAGFSQTEIDELLRDKIVIDTSAKAKL